MDDRDRVEFDVLHVTMMLSCAILSPPIRGICGRPRDSDALTFLNLSFIMIGLRESTMITSCC